MVVRGFGCGEYLARQRLLSSVSPGQTFEPGQVAADCARPGMITGALIGGRLPYRLWSWRRRPRRGTTPEARRGRN
jgi:hypothetical protein